jgi:hydrogenase nickel incorporation protein HypA/HybF
LAVIGNLGIICIASYKLILGHKKGWKRQRFAGTIQAILELNSFKYRKSITLLMHETIIAKDIIAAAEEAAKGRKISSITVEVGDLGHLPAWEMKQALEAIAKYKVDVKEIRAEVKCECGYSGEPEIIEKHHGHTLFECPECGNLPEVLSGEDIVLKKVDVE